MPAASSSMSCSARRPAAASGLPGQWPAAAPVAAAAHAGQQHLRGAPLLRPHALACCHRPSGFGPQPDGWPQPHGNTLLQYSNLCLYIIHVTTSLCGHWLGKISRPAATMRTQPLYWTWEEETKCMACPVAGAGARCGVYAGCAVAEDRAGAAARRLVRALRGLAVHGWYYAVHVAHSLKIMLLSGRVSCLDGRNGDTIVSGSYDGVVRIWSGAFSRSNGR